MWEDDQQRRVASSAHTNESIAENETKELNRITSHAIKTALGISIKQPLGISKGTSIDT